MPNKDNEISDLVKAVASVLERRRQEIGMSQEELSRLAGISRTYLSDIERGLRNISLGTLEKLGGAMNMTPATLLAMAEDERGGIRQRAQELERR